MIKYRWKVAPEPTGKYRSFEHRSWPTAFEVSTGHWVCYIRCEDEYVPRRVAAGDHRELTVLVSIACRGEERAKHGRFRWAKLKQRCATLTEAKELFAKFLATHPDHDFGIGE